MILLSDWTHTITVSHFAVKNHLKVITNVSFKPLGSISYNTYKLGVCLMNCALVYVLFLALGKAYKKNSSWIKKAKSNNWVIIGLLSTLLKICFKVVNYWGNALGTTEDLLLAILQVATRTNWQQGSQPLGWCAGVCLWLTIELAGNMKKKLVLVATLTRHFMRNTCTPAYTCNHQISQSCGTSVMHNIMQIQVRSFS